MDPSMWPPFSNNRFGEFPMHPGNINPPVSQAGVPVPGYGGSGIPSMMPVDNFTSPYMLSPYDNLINKASVNDMNGSQPEMSKPGLDLNTQGSNMSSVAGSGGGSGANNAPLWSPLVSVPSSPVPPPGSAVDMPPKTVYSDLQYSGQMNRMSPVPSGGFQHSPNSQQMAPCSPAPPQSPMIQRSQTPTHATDLRLDTSNRLPPRPYPGSSQSPTPQLQQLPSPGSKANAVNPTIPENFNHAHSKPMGEPLLGMPNSHNPMAAPYPPYPASVPYSQQPSFSSNAQSSVMKSPSGLSSDSNAPPKATYPSVITHAGSTNNSDKTQEGNETSQELPTIDAQFLDDSLNEKNQSASSVSNEGKPAEEVDATDDNGSEKDYSNSEESDSEEPSLNPNDPSLQPVVKLNALPTDQLKELSNQGDREMLETQPEVSAILHNHFLEESPSKAVFADVVQELGYIKDRQLAKIQSKVVFGKRDTGFMKSFLRFLKGEQEPSLVTPTRQYIRRYEPQTFKKAVTVPEEPVSTEKKTVEAQNSDSGIHSVDEDNTESQAIKVDRPTIRGRGRGRGMVVSRKRTIDSDEENRPPEKVSRESSEPRRSSRRLRTKSNVSYRSMEYTSDTEEEDFEVDDPEPVQEDSDSDPAWTPVVAKEQDQEDDEDERIVESPPSQRARRRVKPGQLIVRPVKKKEEAVKTVEIVDDSSQSSQPSVGDDSKDGFKAGDFIVARSDIREFDNPPIWRVDGKNLLQKYSAEKKDGKWLYSNISTYAGYTTQTVQSYMKINVKIHNFSRNEVTVEWLKDENELEPEVTIEEVPAETITEMNSYQESFEIFIQTLISQALDVNFLTEIYQEKDDYFVSNMEKIDHFTEAKRKKIVELFGWCNEEFIKSVGSWPCVNIMDLSSSSEPGNCQACDKAISAKLLMLYGQTYDPLTLGGGALDESRSNTKKDWNTCEDCTGVVELYSKLMHQKYNYYTKCASRVANRRQEDPAKDTTDILNELLADDPWLNTLFHEARSAWSQVDVITKNKAKD